MNHRIAFAGFRHPHIISLLQRVKEHPHCELVGAWENDAATREQLRVAGQVELTHEDFQVMLAESGCTIVAIGDTYGRRGPLAIAALKAGKHVISDKPICINLQELEEISNLAEKNGLSVGCQLDLVENPAVLQLRSVVQAGTIGEVCTINISAQHPLRYGVRASWYFEPGQHGGTINDIGIHVFHLAPWLTDSAWKSLLVARDWNAKAAATPHFKDCAQVFALLENGATCFADLSYLAPNKLGFELPQYWRITVHGTKGMAEMSYSGPEVTVATDDDSEPRKLPLSTEKPVGYLQEFLDEIEGHPSAAGLTTSLVLSVARQSLEAQATADRGQA